MTDTQTQDFFTMMDSSIIKQQIVDFAQKAALFLGSLAILFGMVVPPEKIALIAAAIVAFIGMGLSAFTIWHRMTRLCPPIDQHIIPDTMAKTAAVNNTQPTKGNQHVD